MRQAISMLIDRDLYIDTFRNTKEFEDSGLSVPRRWHTCIPCGYDDFWLNPQDQKAFGENAKYYQYNQAEAKKLIRAVNPNGIEADFIWTNNQYGPAFANMAQVLQQMWGSTGDLKFRVKNSDFQIDWRPNYDRKFGKYSGVSLGSAGSGTPDVNGQITARLHVGDNERTGHLDDSGNTDQRLEDLIARQRSELDVKKRAAIIYEMQQYVAKQQYYLLDAGDAIGFSLAWPWLGNWGVYRTWTGGVDATEVYPHLWVDEAARKKA
jgi:ABC-type transport system substrate-binding protein